MDEQDSIAAHTRAAEVYMAKKAASPAQEDATPIGKTVSQAKEQFLRRAKYKIPEQIELTPEQWEAIYERRREIDAEMERLRNPPIEQRFARIVGADYSECRLDNFRIEPDWPVEAREQAGRVLARLREVEGNVRKAVEFGRGIVLCGAPGVGKDHLAAAVMWAAINAGLSCKWTNGGKFGALAMDQFGEGRLPERIWLDDWVKPDVLTISDPDGNRSSGPTDHVLDSLYKVVDARQREGKPTWITINGHDPKVWVARLSARTWDRLLHKAWLLHCNWPGSRKPRGVV